MKILRFIWATTVTIWVTPLIAVTYLGMFVYTCYSAMIGYDRAKMFTAFAEGVSEGVNSYVTVMKDFIAG